MKPETIESLLALNAAFYQRAARAFSETRRAPWPGWEKLLERFDSPIAVLDLGCGNGRFYAELERRGLVREYLGVDTSPPLLELARASHPKARFVEADATALVAEPRFDLVVAFGLLHHLPSFELREKLVASLRDHLVGGGLACLTFWRFAERERFLDRMVPFDDGLEVEPGDYLIEFKEEGARYCHHSSEVEIGELLAATGMTEIDRYSADGESGDLNLYSVLARS
jgi:tRNA (uracil-5-)-methyltransferase TRM9